MSDDDFTKLTALLHPYLHEQLNDVKDTGACFVHYTSAAVAVSIIKNKQIWMRNAMTMNDFSEVQYGLDLLFAAYRGKVGELFKESLESVFPGVCSKFEKTFDSLHSSLKRDTYLTCFSRHRVKENGLGRLSMWRAYGGQNGVALVVNSDVFSLRTNSLGAYSSPVLYANQLVFDKWFGQVAENIQRENAFFRRRGEVDFQNRIFNLCRFAVLCTKHPGFAEEEEWRVIYSLKERSDKLYRDVEIVRGVPQIVYKLPLKDHPAEGLVGLEIPKLFNRIIIGPTDNAFATYEALVELLDKAGVADAGNKVFESQIPLRHK